MGTLRDSFLLSGGRDAGDLTEAKFHEALEIVPKKSRGDPDKLWRAFVEAGSPSKPEQRPTVRVEEGQDVTFPGLEIGADGEPYFVLNRLGKYLGAVATQVEAGEPLNGEVPPGTNTSHLAALAIQCARAGGDPAARYEVMAITFENAAVDS